MNFKKKTVLQSLSDYFQEVEQSIEQLQNQLDVVKLERDLYKQQVVELQESNNKEVSKQSVAHVTVYSEDNGEGVDTEICIGVFTTKSKALYAILDLCQKHKALNSQSFDVLQFNVSKTLSPNDTVYVIQEDREEHCEISTNIIDVYCENILKNDDNEYYAVEYKVDEVYYIEG